MTCCTFDTPPQVLLTARVVTARLCRLHLRWSVVVKAGRHRTGSIKCCASELSGGNLWLYETCIQHTHCDQLNQQS